MVGNEEVHAFGPSIWTLRGSQIRLFGIPFTTRMTIVQLSSGGLWLHSPVEPNSARKATVAELGTVEHLIAPNKIHSLGIAPWNEIYPLAQIWVSPQYNGRHPRSPSNEILTDAPPPSWQGDFEQVVFRGSKHFDEVVFFHKGSRTLILTDLIQRHDPLSESWFWRLVKSAAGVLGEKGGTSRDLRLVFSDRAAARKSADTILNWDFDRVILSHGLCMRDNAHHLVKRAFNAWLD